MQSREVSTEREFLLRLEHDADWRRQVEAFADEEGIDAGWFFGLGAVKDADLLFYDQDDREYQSVEFDEPLEVAACLGNVADLDGDLFAHTHAVLSRRSGQSLAGHLDAATVFTGEVYLREFAESLPREHDRVTDLDLWL
mgnify:CR=1 FL=1